MIITDTSSEAFNKVSIDTVGKFRNTSSEKYHLLTMQCHPKKYVIAVPIKNLKATTIADALNRHLICNFGAPAAVLSDHGTSFLSEVVKTLLHMLKINHPTTSGYRPQTNGSLERSHAPLIDHLRIYSDNFDDWDRLTPFAVFTYNTSKHAATGYTPLKSVHGRVARFPMQIPREGKLGTYNQYLQDLIIMLSELKLAARENQIQSKIRSKKYYDKKAKVSTERWTIMSGYGMKRAQGKLIDIIRIPLKLLKYKVGKMLF